MSAFASLGGFSVPHGHSHGISNCDPAAHPTRRGTAHIRPPEANLHGDPGSVMTDFYSILFNSLKKRDIWDSIERMRLYERARMALIKKLWALRPSISAAQIQDRMELFELAVDRLEADVAIAERFRQWDGGNASSRAGGAASLPQARIGDDAWPAIETGSSGRDQLGQQQSSRSGQLRLPAATHRTGSLPPGRAGQNRGHTRKSSWADDEFEKDAAQANPRPEGWQEDEEDWQGGREDAHPAAKGARPRIPQAMDRLLQLGKDKRRGSRWDEQAGHEDRAPAETHRLRAYLDRSIRRLAGRAEESGYGERHILPTSTLGRVATGGAMFLALAIAASGVFYLLPLLRDNSVVSGRPGEESAANSAQAATSQAQLRGAAANSPANQPAARPSDSQVVERISLFDGRNPTVFTTSADNPIRFTGDNNGGFARIGSTTGSPGARASIGPGIVQRIAGKRVRIVLETRSSAEQGAGSLRFGYQAGNQVSPWKSSPLSKIFAPTDFTWQVPAGAGTGNNFILIEPGIAGSGAAIDIKSITLEVLKPA